MSKVTNGYRNAMTHRPARVPRMKSLMMKTTHIMYIYSSNKNFKYQICIRPVNVDLPILNLIVRNIRVTKGTLLGIDVHTFTPHRMETEMNES